jgi:hypothetical protein
MRIIDAENAAIILFGIDIAVKSIENVEYYFVM